MLGRSHFPENQGDCESPESREPDHGELLEEKFGEDAERRGKDKDDKNHQNQE